jgi:intracellular proteinase inhibitor BsuPI
VQGHAVATGKTPPAQRATKVVGHSHYAGLVTAAAVFPHERRFPRILPPIVAILASQACASATAFSTGTASSLTVSGPFSLRLEVPPEVAGGQPVPLRLVLTNVGKDTLRIILPGQTHRRADFVVMRRSKKVWQKLRRGAWEDIAMEGRLAPNDSLVFQDLWPQQTNHGGPVGPGKYTVKGIIDESGVTKALGGIVSAPVAFRIR